VTRQPKWSLGLLTVEVLQHTKLDTHNLSLSLSHTHTHTHTHTTGKTSLKEWSVRRRGRYLQNTHETNIDDFSGIRNPRSQQSRGFKPTPYSNGTLIPLSLLRHSIFTQSQYTNGFLEGVFRLITSHTLSSFGRDILYVKFVASHFVTARLTYKTRKYNEQRVRVVRHTSASPRETFTIISLNTVTTNLLALINCNTSNWNIWTLKSGPTMRVGLLHCCLRSRTAKWTRMTVVRKTASLYCDVRKVNYCCSSRCNIYRNTGL